MKPQITESEVEDFAINRLRELGYEYRPGPTLLSAEHGPAERGNTDEVILQGQLRSALQRLNKGVSPTLQEAALRELQGGVGPELIATNLAMHTFLTEGVKVQTTVDGHERGLIINLIDFDDVTNNSYIVANQVVVTQNGKNRRPDVILYVNGLPLVVIELKNPADAKADTRSAYRQIQTYKTMVPNLFAFNTLCVLSDGLEASAGSLSAGFSRFSAWRTVDGTEEADHLIPEIETLIKGLLRPSVLLEVLRSYTVFEEEEAKNADGLITISKVKKVAAYHQYYAVKAAVQSTLRAAGFGGAAAGAKKGYTAKAEQASAVVATTGSQEVGDRRGGVIWHTQGSGKSLSMVFFAGQIIQAMDNPTVVVITDRNDLDDQLFDTFFASRNLLRQVPVQAETTAHLKELLAVEAGGVVFSTIQKFSPAEGNIFELLSGRENIVVITDEAHRSQYGFSAREKKIYDKETKEQVGSETVYGYAKYLRDALPQATYLGFTGTPIEGTDTNTVKVFGNYIDIYDIAQAVKDGATVPIYYESRLAKVHISDEGRQQISELDEEIGELNEHEAAKARWTQVEALIGNPDLVREIAKDIVYHFEQRQEVFIGKGMVVAMSRRIAAALYEAIVALRPEWHSDDLMHGAVKVVMTTASTDVPMVIKHHTTKKDRKTLAARMRDANDPLKLVIVRDMWLTGFDAPSLHTMYIDKPMKGHSLMQAIARVNRVYKDKPGGLIVDYLGIASDLKEALKFYAKSGGTGDPTKDQEEAVGIMLEKLDVIQGMLHRFEYRPFFSADTREKLRLILETEDYILGLPRGKDRFINEVTILSRAYAIAVPHHEALDARDEISFFQAIKARLTKFDVTGEGRSDAEMETTIRQVVDQALVPDGVVDIYDAAGLEKKDLSILDDEFLQSMKEMPQQNVALQALRKLLNDEIKERGHRNIVQRRSLLEMLEDTIKRYHNKAITAVEVIEEMIKLAKHIRSQDQEYTSLGLTEYEYAFYTALADNDSAREVMQKDKLRELAVELSERVKKSATIDWTVKETVRAKLRVVIKRALRKFGYPPDMQKLATETVLKQAEALAFEISGGGGG